VKVQGSKKLKKNLSFQTSQGYHENNVNWIVSK